MPTDSSLALYRCPFCKKLSRDKEEVLVHIEDETTGAHQGQTRATLDRPIPELFPRINDLAFGAWAESVRQYAEENHEAQDDAKTVRYTKAAEELDLPKSFVLYQLEKEGYTPMPRGGSARTPTDWDSLNEDQQSTLLAWAYFPEKTHEEIGKLDYSGHDYQGTVSKYIRQYGWMLAHPGIDTPVYPTDQTDDRGELETEGDAEEMLSNHTEIVQQKMLGEDEQDEADEVVGEIESTAIEATMEATGPASSTDEPRGEPEEEAPAGDVDANVDSGVVIMESDLSFEAIAAMIETGRYEEAREIYRRATSTEKYDVRWEVDSE